MRGSIMPHQSLVVVLITDGETGWLVEPLDTEVMADRIVHALGNITEARCIGERARERIAKDFSVEKMVLAYDQLYRELAACRRTETCS